MDPLKGVVESISQRWRHTCNGLRQSRSRAVPLGCSEYRWITGEKWRLLLDQNHHSLELTKFCVADESIECGVHRLAFVWLNICLLLSRALDVLNDLLDDTGYQWLVAIWEWTHGKRCSSLKICNFTYFFRRFTSYSLLTLVFGLKYTYHMLNSSTSNNDHIFRSHELSIAWEWTPFGAGIHLIRVRCFEISIPGWEAFSLNLIPNEW